MNNFVDINKINTNSTPEITYFITYCNNSFTNYLHTGNMLKYKYTICKRCHFIYCNFCASLDGLCIDCIYPDLTKIIKRKCSLCECPISKIMCLKCNKIISRCCNDCNNQTYMNSYLLGACCLNCEE